MSGSNHHNDPYPGAPTVRPILVLFAVMGIFGSPLLLTATPTFDGLIYVAFVVSFTIHCMALFGTLKYNQLALMASENFLFFVLCSMLFLAGILPISLASWEASGKHMFVDYPWYPIEDRTSGGMKQQYIETAFLSGIQVGVFAELMLLAIATFFYVEYRMIQQMTEYIVEKKQSEGADPLT